VRDESRGAVRTRTSGATRLDTRSPERRSRDRPVSGLRGAGDLGQNPDMEAAASRDAVARFERRGVLGIGAIVALVELVFANRYG
jgi:hypothetical protein